jgi:hypothetical protein
MTIYARSEVAHVEAELSWYFTEARGAIEPPSNFGRMVAALAAQRAETAKPSADPWHVVGRSGSRGRSAAVDATELDARLIELCDREYPIRRALSAIGERASQVLEIGIACSPVGLEAFGTYAALAPLTPSARCGWIESSTARSYGEWLVRLSWRVRKSVGDTLSADHVLADRITQEVAVVWRDALGAYCEAADRFGDLRRGRRRRARAAAAMRAEQARRAA